MAGESEPHAGYEFQAAREPIYLREAEAGNSTSMCILALSRYRDGKFTGPDGASEWYVRSIAAGKEAAALQFARLLYMLKDRAHDEAFRRAADMALVEGLACMDLGTIRETDNIIEGFDGAIEWYRRAEAAGTREGAFRIGLIRLSQGNRADTDGAVEWFRRSVDGGMGFEYEVQASAHLGILLAGEGLLEGTAGAEHWLRRYAFSDGKPGLQLMASFLQILGRTEEAEGFASAARLTRTGQKTRVRIQVEGEDDRLRPPSPSARFVTSYPTISTPIPLGSVSRREDSSSRTERARTRTLIDWSVLPEVGGVDRESDVLKSLVIARDGKRVDDFLQYFEEAFSLCGPPPILDERLSRSWIHYPPDREGVFVGFSDEITGHAAPCACMERPATNWFRLKELSLQSQRAALESAFVWDVQTASPIDRYEATLRISWRQTFPQCLPPPAGLASVGVTTLPYAPGVCHRCQGVVPKDTGDRRFTPLNPIWLYYSQEWLRQGFPRIGHCATVLSDQVDPLLLELAEAVNEANSALDASAGGNYDAFLPLVKDTDRTQAERGIANYPDGLTPPRNFLVEPQSVRKALLRVRGDAQRNLTHEITSAVRSSFRNVPWGRPGSSEARLRGIVTALFPGETIQPNIRPEWLGRLELDIFLPNQKLAIEYNGIQHYLPVEVWGGSAALKEVQRRDKRKVELCAAEGVTLIVVHYQYPLDRTSIARLILREGGEIARTITLPEGYQDDQA